MRNICLTVAYDGTNYHGFQRQKNSVAVQNVLEKALGHICGENIELAAAGRTDTGVHALGQVVNFFTEGTIPTEKIPQAVNGLLPSDIAVLNSFEADMNFNARHSAKRKTYIYRIHSGKAPNPFTRNYAWHIPRELDLCAMETALQKIVGIHDFTSFRAAGGAPVSPVREVYHAGIEKTAGDRIEITVTANGFLYHMARNIVGSLADVGKGRMTVKRFGEILLAKDRKLASPTAPACGLYLKSVEY